MYDTPLIQNWSEDNPVHLLGHSCGATTAIELYQLLCQDAFGVGSSYKWVKSIVSVAGPLSGSTLTHMFGIHDHQVVPYSFGHAIGAVLCLGLRLQIHFPSLRPIFDYRMQQWNHVTSYREILSSHNRILASGDLAVFDILPSSRHARNKNLVHMDKPYLVSIATSSHSTVPKVMLLMGTLLTFGFIGVEISLWYESTHSFWISIMVCLLTISPLHSALRQMDYASLPCLSII